MRLRKLMQGVAATAVTAGILAGMIGGVDAADRVRWKMQSAFPSTLSVVGEASARYEEVMDRISGGEFKIKFFEPGALVPALECFDSVAKGALESCMTTPGYHTGKIPALAFFTTVPFGPEFDELMAWLKYGGGEEIKDRVYAEHGLKSVYCNGNAAETSGWFRQEITSLDQLKGLKMRFFGLGALVMQKVGVSTQLLAGADIYPALERGVIDATEFSMPSIDESLGFNEVAKHNYFPGWHQRYSIGELLINADEWKKLNDQQQGWVETACNDNMLWTYVRSAGLQFRAMKRLQEKGVTFHRWPDEIIKIFKEKWDEVVAEQSAKDPLFKEAYESYSKFREDYAIWREMQAMPELK